MQRKGVAAFGEIRVDFDRMEIWHSGRIIAATAQEFRLLKFFVDNPDYVFTRDQLLGAVWPERKRINGRTVDNSIAHLRQKIEEDPSCPVYFQTIHGVGYKFVPFGKAENVRTRRKRQKSAELSELKAATDRLAQALADVDEKEFLAEFRGMRRRGKRATR